jgi:hypothetical protein
MKRFAVFIGLCGVAFFLAKIMEYVFEYYEIRWTRVEIRK